jgi:hypothetical protein
MSATVCSYEWIEVHVDDRADVIRVYQRDLPDRGFVAIDVRRVRAGLWRPRRYAGSVIVERRSARRNGNHPPPVIARAAGRTVEDVVQALLPAARSNETIGAACLRFSRMRRGSSTVGP